MRNKGKVHPFTSSSSPSLNPNSDPFSVLELLPVAVFTLVSVLSLEDREVLAYMITRSLKSTTNPPFFPAADNKKPSKKQSLDCHGGHNSPALFDCDCFDCYTSFWFRWDSSPNGELIHQAIEAFEEHLSSGEQSKKNGSGKNKKREKVGRRKSEKVSAAALEIVAAGPPENHDGPAVAPPENEVAAAEADSMEDRVECDEAPPPAAVRNHKGLARKVLPDVMGILNSRFWSLWSPNV